VFLFLLLVSSAGAQAQDWAKRMFTDKPSHDFGTVVRGAKTEHRFKFKNIYVEDVHVESVRASCGCTTPEVTKRDLKTYESSEIVAVFNTHAFVGQRSATITVRFDKPFLAEMQLHVQGFIRGDIMVQPNFVDLGTVDQGHEAERLITVTNSSRPDWKILDIRCANTSFEVEPILRPRQRGQVSYDLKVKLKPDAPAGYINDQLILVTNDSSSSQFPIDVEGRVVPELSVAQMINFGSLDAGSSATRPLIVRSTKKPFKILSITCDDERFSFKLPDAAAPPKTLYQIPVTFIADDHAGRVAKRIYIETDRGKSSLPPVIAQATIRQSPTATESTGEAQAGATSETNKQEAAKPNLDQFRSDVERPELNGQNAAPAISPRSNILRRKPVASK
jgi:hypothetical protein